MQRICNFPSCNEKEGIEWRAGAIREPWWCSKHINKSRAELFDEYWQKKGDEKDGRSK